MPKHSDSSYHTPQRTRIASAAARLIAETGLVDYAQAKRKAAHSLGLPDSAQLPDNAEVEVELRRYQSLFQDEEQASRITFLRQKACEVMEKMQRFRPYLTGSVLDGSAGRYAEIDIQLFTDSSKDVEIYLLNQGVDFEHSQPRSERIEAVLTITDEDAVINLVIYPPHAERVSIKTRDGRTRQRARLEAVRQLLENSSTEQLPTKE